MTDEIAIPDEAALGIAGVEIADLACAVCHVWPGHDIPSHIAAVKADVLAGIEDGTFPTTVRTFSELHDHCDANMLDGLGDSLSVPDDVEDEDERDAANAVLTDIFNEVTDAVNEWLATRPMGGEVTPLTRAKSAAEFIRNHYPKVSAAVGATPDGTPHVFIEALYDASGMSLYALPDGWAWDYDDGDAAILKHGGDGSLFPNARPVGANDIAGACWATMRRIPHLDTYAKIDLDD